MKGCRLMRGVQGTSELTVGTMMNMSTHKRFFALVALSNNFVLVTGGRSAEWQLLKKVERMDISKNKWTDFPEMTVARECHSSCFLDEAVYSICGFDQKNVPLSSIERIRLDSRSG